MGQGPEPSRHELPRSFPAHAHLPVFRRLDPSTGSVDTLKAAIREQVGEYRNEYRRYYDSFATPDSPKLRDRTRRW